MRYLYAMALALLCACADKKETSDEPEPTPIEIPGRACPDGSIITYENFADAFMRDHCTGCHSTALADGERQNAPLGVDLDTYDLVREQATSIYFFAADENTIMPPAGGPSAQDRIDLGDWLACNAPREES